MSVRGVFLVTLLIFIVGYLTISNSSKEKQEYTKVSGQIEFLDQQYKDLPNRDEGSYRYLKVSSYPFVFEIYEPNHEAIRKSIDNLKAGDVIDVYFYETYSTQQEGINRYAQFIDSNNEPFFIRSGFQKQLGYLVIVLGVLVNLLTFYFWKKGKLRW